MLVKSRQCPRNAGVLVWCWWYEHVPMTSTKQKQHKAQGQPPYPPRIYFAKGQMNLAICHHQVKVSKARERAKGRSSAVPSSVIASGDDLISKERESLWQLHSISQTSQVCQGHHARH